jgi:hypothetical protein
MQQGYRDIFRVTVRELDYQQGQRDDAARAFTAAGQQVR